MPQLVSELERAATIWLERGQETVVGKEEPMLVPAILFLISRWRLIPRRLPGVVRAVLDGFRAAAARRQKMAITQTGAGATHTMKCDERGGFVFGSLPPGDYRTGVTHGGFKKLAVGALAMEGGAVQSPSLSPPKRPWCKPPAGEHAGVMSVRNTSLNDFKDTPACAALEWAVTEGVQ
jgi:hypothetical protein